jgi:hypothetical protein
VGIVNDGGWVCGDCRGTKRGDEFATEVNPPGGYGRPQLLVCDDCMRSDRWAHWRAEKWPNWPDPRELP